ncbi:hypothetical protein O181_055211 [Austropuccinia psidii MF-1]|uniref:CCHC-type domain-containing protein n=1 Tax=Austropuccinia psidii MF-1 TaxID=1389203 RepID=A0A9Q3EAX3_9BASI|nr:hypothetical protein [Austropuccinia psidii MF-1]
MQEPYGTHNRISPLLNDGSSYRKWLSCVNCMLCIAFSSEESVSDSPSLLNNRSAVENQAISHFINLTIPHDFVLCVGIIPSRTTAKQFFEAIKTQLCPGNQFQKLKVVRNMVNLLVENGSGMPKTNTQLILSLCQTFVLLEQLKVEAYKLEGLIAQAACHASPTLNQVAFDQLVMAAILAKNEDKPSSTFVGQVILNASSKAEDFARNSSSFVYFCGPPEHLVDKFGAACFHCRQTGQWRADCPQTKGVANPNPRLRSPSLFPHARARTPEPQFPLTSNSRFHREWVSQLQFVERHAADKVLTDSGASIHLSGSSRFTSNLCLNNPFKKNCRFQLFHYCHTDGDT